VKRIRDYFLSFSMWFQRDEDGTLGMVPKQYIDWMINQYEQMFGSRIW